MVQSYKKKPQLQKSYDTIVIGSGMGGLATAAILSKEGQNDGFLLKHSVGSIPNNSEVDVSLTYADYYFLESLQRYKKWYL